MADTHRNNAKPEITLIWLNESRSQRIVWLLEELGLEYDVKPYKRTKDFLAPEELKQYHPLGKAPVVIVNGTTLAESGFITEYLIDHYGPQLKPAENSPKFLQYRHLLHYAEGSLMPYMVLALIANKIRGSPVPFFLKPITSRIADTLMNSFIGPNITNNFDYLEGLIQETGWFAGSDITGADILLSYPIEAGSGRLGSTLWSKEKYPGLVTWMEKIRERPAYKRASEKITVFEAKI